MKNEIVQLSVNVLVEKYNIIGTRVWIFQAWRKSDGWGYLDCPYSTITTHGDVLFGEIGTERGSLDTLDDRRGVAINAILMAFPEAARGKARGNQIEIIEG